MTAPTAPIPIRRFVDPDQPAYGRVIFYTVADVAFSHDQVEAELAALGLDRYAPRRPADVDVFRRVSTGAAEKGIDLGDGTYANILVRDVTNDGAEDSVLRRVVVEVVDSDNEQLGYTEAYDLRFFKDGGRLTMLPLLGVETPADEVAAAIRSGYFAKRGTINGDAVRMLLKKAIRGADGVCIRPSGGVFFVPEDHAEVVDRLHSWARQHVEHVSLFSFPLVRQAGSNDEDLLAGAVSQETMEDCERLLGELIGGNVSERRLNAIAGEHAALSKRLHTYQALLADGLDSVSTKVDALDTAVRHAMMGGSSLAEAA